MAAARAAAGLPASRRHRHLTLGVMFAAVMLIIWLRETDKLHPMVRGGIAAIFSVRHAPVWLDAESGATADDDGVDTPDGSAPAPLILAAPPSDTLACSACIRHSWRRRTRTCVPAACAAVPTTGRRVVAMSLYGSNPRYAESVIRTAELMPPIMPGWLHRVYVWKDSDVPASSLRELRKLGVEVAPVDNSQIGFGMNWRFLVADDASVDAFIVRDADSRPTLREAWATAEWMASGKPYHVLRDHIAHNSPVLGGLWGARRAKLSAALGSMADAVAAYVSRTGDADKYGADMNFLASVLWPIMAAGGVLQHDSFFCQSNGGRWAAPDEHGRPFPRPRTGAEHAGQTHWFDGAGDEETKSIDIITMRDKPGHPACASRLMPSTARRGISVADALAAAPAVAPAEVAACRANCSSAWRQASGGVCSLPPSGLRAAGGGDDRPPCVSSLLHLREAHIDSLNPPVAGFTDNGDNHTSVFDFERHVVVGAHPGMPASAVPAPLNMYERIPDHGIDPVAALNGGLRAFPALLLVQPALGVRMGDEEAWAREFVAVDMPRLLQVAGVSTLLLLPPAVAAAIDSAIAAALAAGSGGGGIGVDEAASRAWLLAMAGHVIAHEGAPALYYAPDAYVFACTCPR
jgi:hypothetical protein